MKRLIAATILTLLVLAPLAVSAQTTMFKFNQDGEFAAISQSTDPNSNFTLNVSRNFSTGAGTSASISYLAFTFARISAPLPLRRLWGRFPAPPLPARTPRI